MTETSAMRVVHKFTLPDAGVVIFTMPKGARALSVQAQRGVVTLWALVNPTSPSESRTFCVRQTGEQFPCDPRLLTFVGTVQLSGGNYVVHVFEVTL